MEKTVVIASMGRSGSTLTANVINCDNSYRILFEPFFPEKVEEARDFIYPHYMRPDNRDAKLLLAAQNILDGKIRSPWIDRENRQIVSNRRLIKDIRVNLFLKWLYDNFPGLKIILLIRHPCAVVQSWLASDFGDGIGSRDRLLSHPEFMQDYGSYLRDEYRNAKTAFERLIFFWCVYYRVPLQQFSEKEIYLLFYENLLCDTENELLGLSSFLDQSFSETAVYNALSQPSSTTRSDSEVVLGGDKISGWRKKVSPNQITSSLDIMKLFGMENLYCPATLKPRQEVALRLLRSD